MQARGLIVTPQTPSSVLGCASAERAAAITNAGDGLPARFQTALARASRAPWMLAVGEDSRYRCTEGVRSDTRTRLMHRYMDAIGRLTTGDAEVRLRLLRAFHMIARPSSLLSPAVIWRVLANFGFQETRASAPAAGRTSRIAGDHA